MKKKVLIGTVNMEVGGIEKTLIGLLKRIDYSKYDIDLFLLKTNGDFISEIPESVNIITPYKSKVLERICNSKNIICKIIKHTLFNYITGKLWVNNKKYDTAISYAGYYPFIDSYIMNTKSNNKLIWVHTDLNYIYNTSKFYKIRIILTKNKYERFNKIVCVSDSIKKEFVRLFPNLINKTIVQWNVVDINKNKDKYPILDGDKIIVSVGRITSQKRYDKLVFVHKKLIQNGIKLIGGIDEVGRGPLVGPVVAACVILPLNYKLEGLTDSKKLSEKKREELYPILIRDAISYGIGIVDAKKIDEVNIYQASKLAMYEAINNLDIKPKHVLIDAMKLDLDIPSTSIIKGDAKSLSIAAASVIAKVTRDHMMLELDKKYPEYGFKKHKGYPTKMHIEALTKYGLLDCYRMTYGPVKQILERSEENEIINK